MNARALKVFCFVGLLTGLLSAVSPASGTVPRFSDDFGSKPLGSWTPSPLGLLDNWDGSAETALYNGGGHTQLYAGDPAWHDYTVAAAFRLENSNDYPGGLRGRVNPATGEGYAAWIYPSQGTIRLYRAAAWHIDTPGLALLGEAAVSAIPAGVFHSLSLTFQGGVISVSYNGAVVLQAEDAMLAAGMIALDVSNQPIEFDDVVVTAGSSTLFIDDFSPRPLRNWTPSPLGLLENWNAATGVAVYNGGGHTQLYTGDAVWKDYAVQAGFRLENGDNYPGGIRGRVNPATGESYAAWIYPTEGVIRLWRVVAWHVDTPGPALLQEVSVGNITPGVFHTLGMSFVGIDIRVSFDGLTIIHATDDTWVSGGIALDVSNQPIGFDDVEVTPLTASAPNTLFSDSFDSGILENWTPSPLGLLENWNATSGAAEYNGGGHTQLYAGDSTWTDYQVETTFRLTNGLDYPGGLRGRVNTVTGEGYEVWIRPAEGKLLLYRVSSWHIDTPPLTLLGAASVTIPVGSFQVLAMVFEGELISVVYNHAMVIQVTDAAYGSGAIALDVSNQPIAFDDVVVTPVERYEAGPGGPVLVLGSNANPFSRYLGEILLAEGLNHYAVRDIETVSSATLAEYDVVILGEVPLTPQQVAMLTDWVLAGGNLVAMRPDVQLASLLGIAPAGSVLSDGYLLVDTSAPPGAGIVGETIQYHGPADLYTAGGATVLAALYSDAFTSTPNPAVTLRTVGSLGGSASAFTYDLARSVVLTRQGNPAWSGQKRDGTSGPIRSDDLFYPYWIDFHKIEIPQADEQQRLLANLILHVNSDRKPLPRFWYLPRGEKAVVVMTGDDHSTGGTAGQFETFRTMSTDGCSVEDWQCIRGTSYIYTDTPLTNDQVDAYETDGFEVALHVSTDCADWTPTSLAEDYATQLAGWKAKYTSLEPPTTNRTHCIAWSDYVTQPKVELANGIRLDTNYYYWPEAWILDRPGFMTGSGMPMRFADVDGSIIDVYQATTQMTDESGQPYPYTAEQLLDNALLRGYYGVFTTNMHTDRAIHEEAMAIVAAAQKREVPVVSAQQMLTWLDGRNSSSFGSLSWTNGVLSFRVLAGAGAQGLQGMLPMNVSLGSLTSITANGDPVTFTTDTIKGIAYAIFPAVSGNYEAVYTP